MNGMHHVHVILHLPYNKSVKLKVWYLKAMLSNHRFINFRFCNFKVIPTCLKRQHCKAFIRIDPIALRTAKTLRSFGRSECNRVNKDIIFIRINTGYYTLLAMKRSSLVTVPSTINCLMALPTALSFL